MNITIRNLEAKDIDQLITLERKMADYHHSLRPNYWKSADDTNWDLRKSHRNEIINKDANLWLVAEVNNQIVGYMSAEIIPASPVKMYDKIGYIKNTYVIPEFRKKGIIKKGLQRISEWFNENNIKIVELNVDVNNKEGIEAWKHLGFEEQSKRMALEL